MTHVLACRLEGEGDVLLTGPAIRALASRAERVTLLCGPRGRAAAELLPGVDEVVTCRAPWADHDAEPVRRTDVDALVDRLAALRADEAIVFGSSDASAFPTALVVRLAGIPRVAAICEDDAGSLVDVRHPDPVDVHEVERALSLARAAGYPLPDGDDTRLAVLRPAAGAPTPAGGSGYVVVHPGASAPARTPSPPWWAGLVDALLESGRRAVVTGSRGERALTRFVAGEHGLDLGGATDLATLAEVLTGADALVVGNSGPAHLAAAVGTPVVSLFAPVVPLRRWRPWGVPSAVLGDGDAPCRGTRARQCPVPGHPCLDGIPTEEAVEAVERMAVRRTGAARTMEVGR